MSNQCECCGNNSGVWRPSHQYYLCESCCDNWDDHGSCDCQSVPFEIESEKINDGEKMDIQITPIITNRRVSFVMVETFQVNGAWQYQVIVHYWRFEENDTLVFTEDRMGEKKTRHGTPFLNREAAVARATYNWGEK